jgi:hypothetical protein
MGFNGQFVSDWVLVLMGINGKKWEKVVFSSPSVRKCGKLVLCWQHIEGCGGQAYSTTGMAKAHRVDNFSVCSRDFSPNASPLRDAPYCVLLKYD